MEVQRDLAMEYEYQNGEDTHTSVPAPMPPLDHDDDDDDCDPVRTAEMRHKSLISQVEEIERDRDLRIQTVLEREERQLKEHLEVEEKLQTERERILGRLQEIGAQRSSEENKAETIRMRMRELELYMKKLKEAPSTQQ